MSSDPILKRASAVLFAGGKSSRMGEDKSLLPFGGYESLSEYQYRRLAKIFGSVYISTKVEKFDFEAPLILDRFPESSPLVALVSLFDAIPQEECFILSVDAPFVSKEVIATLYRSRQLGNYDAIIAQSPGGVQPLCGIYRRSILPYARAMLAEGRHKLNSMLKSADTHFVTFEKETPFANINYPHEYRAAFKMDTDNA